ncbi:GNAT family N-acetyltransferase [Helicovermis profundi]|uniref:N-acetyltransferase domain-containing protein n=1 Tax=Helicovermis profundi TaxID=3065157 RepID=A0AAU9ESQ2_9FIRM|nr:hypothetical protein HLPR_04010 [Clostridia bacterium S502]
MEEIIELKDKDLKELVYFIYKNIDKAVYLLQGIEWSKERGFKKIRENNHFYGFYRENILSGIFLFSSSNVLFPYNEDIELIKKIDMLRIIKKHNPFMIKGSKLSVDIIWKMIERISSNFKMHDCFLMKNMTRDPFELDTVKTKVLEYKNMNFNNSIKFLLDVEKEFNRNPLSINRLKIKLQDKMMLNEYVAIGNDNNEIISQGIIEFSSYEICVIGGIYTKMNERQNGYASFVTLELINRSISRRQIPYLTVLEDNYNAINMYKRLNFVNTEQFKIIEMIL